MDCQGQGHEQRDMFKNVWDSDFLKQDKFPKWT